LNDLYCETLSHAGQIETIVLVHGWAMHSGVWREFALQLAQQYQVILIDLPGHGRSKPIPDFKLEKISNEIIKAVPDKRSCWLGWSLGVDIVLDIADRFPDRVSSLILVAGNPHFTKTKTWPGISREFLQGFRRSIENNGDAALLRFLLLQLEGTEQAKALAKKLKQIFLLHPVPCIETLLSGLSILQHTDMRPALQAATCPMAIIMGAKDSLVPVMTGTAIQELKPKSQLHIIEDATHIPFLSHPNEVIKLVHGFLD